MQLSRYTDYALRILVYLGIHNDRLSSISEIATAYDISQNHLMKIVHQLGKAGFIDTVRGRRGGLQLNRPPHEISIGSVVRHAEKSEQPIKCGNCIIIRTCILRDIIKEGFEAFYKVFDKYTLGDILENHTRLEQLLHIKTPAICD